MREMTERVKLDVSNFDTRFDLNVFVNWSDSIADYFEGHRMINIERVRFAKMKLIGSTKKY